MDSYEDQVYQGLNVEDAPFHKGKYRYCEFYNCVFTEADIRDSEFIECIFDNCNLSNAKLGNTALKSVEFRECKLVGLRFDEIRAFLLEMSFDDCILDYSTFVEMELKRVRFLDCRMTAVDFSGAQMEGQQLDGCLLMDAIFDSTNLRGADFRLAKDYHIDPRKNVLSKAKFSRNGVLGLLSSFGIVIE